MSDLEPMKWMRSMSRPSLNGGTTSQHRAPGQEACRTAPQGLDDRSSAEASERLDTAQRQGPGARAHRPDHAGAR